MGHLRQHDSSPSRTAGHGPPIPALLWHHEGVSHQKLVLGMNAIRLDRDIQRFYQSSNGAQIVIVANSMGATVTRGFLAYSMGASDGVANTMVDSVFFIEGAQQGSYLAPKFQAATSTDTGSRIAAWIEQQAGLNIDPNRPAMIELAPQTFWYQEVNGVAAPPPDLPYYNFYGDFQILLRNCQFGGCENEFERGWGDGVMLTGSDAPSDHGTDGGARFMRGAAGPTNWQWALIDKLIDDPNNNAPANPVIIVVALTQSPMFHINVGYHSYLSTAMVDDCQGHGRVSFLEQLRAIVDSHMASQVYLCTP